MPVIKPKELKKNLKMLASGEAPGIFLIHGEELLVKTALAALLNALLPGDSRKLNYEPLDGNEASVVTAIEKVNTYSLLAEPKVVAILDAQVFYAKQDTAAVIERARAAFARDESRKAAHAILKVMALLGLSFEDVSPETRADAFKLTAEQRRDDRWLGDLLDYCRQKNMPVPASGAAADRLEQAIARGFPAQQYLTITTDIVDRRRSLYKTIADKGLVIDCAVPKGERKADRAAQAAVLNDQLSQVLKACGKKMAPDARTLLVELAGFNLRAMANSVIQLASFIGERDTIAAEDVRRVVSKTKQDPIFNFTNAITGRDRTAALYFLNSLLAENMYPLQLLAAMVNQIRKLIQIKGFTESPAGSVWQASCPYPQFTNRVIPAIKDYDRDLTAEIDRWEASLSPPAAAKRSKKKKPGKIAAGLMIAQNPSNAYPVYKLFKNAERFTRTELCACLELLDKTDHRLKSTSLDPRLVLEEVILAICP